MQKMASLVYSSVTHPLDADCTFFIYCKENKLGRYNDVCIQLCRVLNNYVPCGEHLDQLYMQGESNSFYAAPTPRLITERPFSSSECRLLLCLHFEQDRLDLLPGEGLNSTTLYDDKLRSYRFFYVILKCLWSSTVITCGYFYNMFFLEGIRYLTNLINQRELFKYQSRSHKHSRTEWKKLDARIKTRTSLATKTSEYPFTVAGIFI